MIILHVYWLALELQYCKYIRGAVAGMLGLVSCSEHGTAQAYRTRKVVDTAQ